MNTAQIPENWKSVTNLEDSITLVDYGVVLTSQDAKRLNKLFNSDEITQFMQHLADRIAEKNENRLIDEILIETILHSLLHAPSDTSIKAFIEQIFAQANTFEASMKIAELILTSELADGESNEHAFATGVSLICEIGIAINQFHRSSPSPESASTLAHLATYLLSVSNTNNNNIRLSLINYFGEVERGIEQKVGLNKVLSRFGHTVFDQLFTLLFNKKTEAVALQFLLENLPYALEGDRHAQTIIHETWKFYMLKYPERFGLFLKTFCEHFNEGKNRHHIIARKPLLQHLGVLLRVVSEVNHKELTHSLISCLLLFDRTPDREEVIDTLLALNDIRPNIKTLLSSIRSSVESNRIIELSSRMIDTKRGRKPSFSRVEGWLTVSQVRFLGEQVELLKAS